ncbi:MAG: aminotransferase DegT [Desulfobacterium sp.]|nr:aminotransferase DegT [Desulfobacterium sp.]
MAVFIPVNEPILSGNEKKYLNECIDSGWISSEGPFVRQFEEGFAKYTGVSYGIAVSNGTAALETALFAIGVGPGDEVIMPTFTIISCAIACLRLGAVPVLVDIEPKTWTINTSQIESKITARTKAIMPVHIYGHPVNMDEIFRIREKYDIKVVEDSAEVHGAQYFSSHYGNQWLSCGAMGDISATSFYANKIITTGEGGMVLTSNPEYASRSRSYRNLCFLPEKRFFHKEIGYNFRMTNLQAAVGLAQLERIDEFINIKRNIGKYYREKLSSIPGVRFQVEMPWARSVYWMYSIEISSDFGIDAEMLQTRLRKKGIGTRPFFLGLHAQPVFQKMGYRFDLDDFPISDHAYRYGLYLPSGLTLTYNKVDKVTNALSEALKE